MRDPRQPVRPHTLFRGIRGRVKLVECWTGNLLQSNMQSMCIDELLPKTEGKILVFEQDLSSLDKLAKKVGLRLKRSGLMLATAESCTGGLLATAITDVPGSSAYFERGFVVYSNRAKHEDLGVKNQTLEKFGAVSEEVAQELAQGVLKYSHAQVGIAITGIAGPTGGTKKKPKGMVCFGLAYQGSKPKTITKYFKGGRDAVRRQAVKFALEWLLS